LHLFGENLAFGTAIFLLLALGLAFGFEMVNGFHDTANAVATVIYTHTLRPTVAVVWSGLWNLIGVLTSTGAVAFSIVALLPIELVLNVGSGAGFAMVFSLLLSAMIWNLGTWYLGLPASSSHTLIGAIMGVGLANSLMSPGQVFGEGVNWPRFKKCFPRC
jgi:inorganic phosphate transporter, PiT family